MPAQAERNKMGLRTCESSERARQRTLVDVGVGVRVAGGLARLAADQAVQVGAGLVRAALQTDGVRGRGDMSHRR